LETSERWLSVEEIAGHLGVSKETIHRWLSKSKIPAHRVGKLWKFKTSEVDSWVTEGGAEEPAASIDQKSKSKAKKKSTPRKG
jgi:excisionase family DNA binding protein